MSAVARDAATSISLQGMVDSKGEIWKISRDAFIQEHGKLGFA
jgi:hypothetical protein